MGDHSRRKVDGWVAAAAVVAAVATISAIEVGASRAKDRRDRKRREPEKRKAKALANTSSEIRESSIIDLNYDRITPMEPRAKSWGGQSNRFSDVDSKPASFSGKPGGLPVPLKDLPYNRDRSPGAQMYRKGPTKITIMDDDESFPEDRWDAEAMSPQYSGEQVREYEVLGEYDLFHQGGGDPAPSSRPTTPIEETKQRYRPYLPNTEYRYTSLPSSGERIRLIQLYPGEKTADLKCSFFEDWLFDMKSGAGGYDAISYSWQVGKQKMEEYPTYPLFRDNSPSEGTFIQSNLKPHVPRVLWIFKSADTVLRRFRQPDQSVILWIDAVCLNQAQKDNDEKHYQLRHMRKIYGKANRVFVWLDEGPSRTQDHDGEDRDTVGEKCIKFFQKYGSWRNNSRLTSRKTRTRALDDHLLESFTITNVSKVATFFSSIKWFSRRWIVQEITHAQQAVVFCGREHVGWEEFSATIKDLWNIPDKRSQFEGRARTALRVLHTIQLLKHPHREKRIRFDILQALQFFYASLCRDSQDRILALLPISSDEDNYVGFYRGLRLDQRKESIYHKFAYFNLTKSCSLDILHCAGAFRPKDNTAPCKASWVPDWTCTPRFASFLKVKKFNTGGSRQFFDIRPESGYEDGSSYGYSPRANSLVVRGFIADTIQYLQSRDIHVRPTLEDFRSFLDEWKGLADCGPLDLNASVPSPKANALAITLIADQGLTESSTTQLGATYERLFEEEDRRQEIKAWIGFRNLFRTSGIPSILSVGVDRKAKVDAKDERGQMEAEDKRAYLEKLNETIKGRRLFRTHGGRLGIGPDDIRTGDYVTVLYGGKTPFILRSMPSGRQQSQKYFCELIGDCYVHGMMDGRLMRESHSALNIWII